MIPSISANARTIFCVNIALRSKYRLSELYFVPSFLGETILRAQFRQTMYPSVVYVVQSMQ